MMLVRLTCFLLTDIYEKNVKVIQSPYQWNTHFSIMCWDILSNLYVMFPYIFNEKVLKTENIIQQNQKMRSFNTP